VSPFLDKLLQLMMAAKNTYPCISVNILWKRSILGRKNSFYYLGYTRQES
jgi:hypothetical protein